MSQNELLEAKITLLLSFASGYGFVCEKTKDGSKITAFLCPDLRDQKLELRKGDRVKINPATPEHCQNEIVEVIA